MKNVAPGGTSRMAKGQKVFNYLLGLVKGVAIASGQLKREVRRGVISLQDARRKR
jgi:hypothetical protein